MLEVTEKAAEKIAKQLERRGKGIGIRIGVKTTGCSGLAYVLEFVDSENPEDLIFVSHRTNLYVNPKSLPYIDGTIIDYARNGLNEGFQFTNPRERDKCGCGESFRVS